MQVSRIIFYTLFIYMFMQLFFLKSKIVENKNMIFENSINIHENLKLVNRNVNNILSIAEALAERGE